MSGKSYERQLEELAFGEDWNLEHLNGLIASVESVQLRITETVNQLSGKWTGSASTTAISRLNVHLSNLSKFRAMLFEAQSIITGMGEFACSADSANSRRASEAQRLLQELPSGVVPQFVHDAVNQGKTIEVPFFGTVDLNRGVEDLANSLGAGREAAAKEKLDQMRDLIIAEQKRIESLSVDYDPLPSGDGGFDTPETFDLAGIGGSSGARGSGGGVPGFPGGVFPGGPNFPGGPGGPGDNGNGGGGNDGGGTGTDPNLPEFHWDPPVVDPPYDPNNPGSGGGGGNEGAGGGSGSRPSVDSSLDGSAVRSGLGAAGLGAAGLAAGARLAAGAGGSGASGGLGQGLAGLTGGLRGAAAAAGTGGGGAGAAGAASAARGARPGGMMMGGGAGGSEKKQAKKSGLGGYIAPHLDDEGDGGPAADASRAGSRG
ncbi:hypothetical protein [Leucobacter japonicus]|uniref:hypothetical protein n=1 Tax=Leucobacter japonicus TaxID=1461259 RepID=UPI000A6BA71B|nr:hypothetical protein [Leucobacter japonicus]